MQLRKGFVDALGSLGELGAGALSRSGRVVQFVRETGRELTEGSHLLQIARHSFVLKLQVSRLKLLSPQTLGDVTEEGVSGDDFAIDYARGRVAFEGELAPVLRNEVGANVLDRLALDRAHEELLAVGQRLWVDDVPDDKVRYLFLGITHLLEPGRVDELKAPIRTAALDHVGGVLVHGAIACFAFDEPAI